MSLRRNDTVIRNAEENGIAGGAIKVNHDRSIWVAVLCRIADEIGGNLRNAFGVLLALEDAF
jgi:hypothetical protein